jgi:hypothetical protein
MMKLVMKYGEKIGKLKELEFGKLLKNFWKIILNGN